MVSRDQASGFFVLDHRSSIYYPPATSVPAGIPTTQISEVAKNRQPSQMGEGKGAEDVLIDSKVSTAQCKLAVDALLKHALAHKAAKEQNELLPDKTEQYIWLVVSVKKMFPERKLKPFKMYVHPLLFLSKEI